MRFLFKDLFHRLRIVGKGHVEEVRYEFLFGMNNRGPNFENGRYDGHHESVEHFISHITTHLMEIFDDNIDAIEKTVNMVFAMKWIIQSEESTTEVSCAGSGPFAATCQEPVMGEPRYLFCESCETKAEIDKWHNLIVKVTGKHVDPRIPGTSMDWAYFGNRLNYVFDQLKDKNIARQTDWRKVAHLVRAVLMYNLSMKMTQKLLHEIDSQSFSCLDVIEEVMGRNRTDSSRNMRNFEQVGQRVADLLKHLTENDHVDDLEHFKQMTTVEGFLHPRNEREDFRYFGRDYEKDEYIALFYKKETESAGTVYGRMLAGRRRILFNPLRSAFVEDLQGEVPEAVYARLRMMGIQVGQPLVFPTRALRSETRQQLWDVIEGWPKCTEIEGKNVLDSEVRYKCTVPAELMIIDTADAITQLTDMRSPLELL